MRVAHVAEGEEQSSIPLPSAAQHGHTHSVSGNVDVHGEHTDDNQHHKHIHFHSPDQLQSKHQTFVKWVGRLGWVGKGIVYAIIGGLCCWSAESLEDSETPQGASASPQGAFVLLASNPGGAPLLIVLAVCVLSYIIWRFAEAITGQGYDAEFSRAKNFFRFRLSPFVSGAVYCAYLAFMLNLLVKMAQGQDLSSSDNGDFTRKWRDSGIGKFGLCILGIAFLAAFLVQVDWVIRGQWHTDYRGDLPKWATWSVFALGHLGCLGRAGIFLAVAVLFFKEVANTYDPADGVGDETTIANAVSQLRGNRSGRAVLFIIGFLVIVYGAFAVVSAWARIFPTPPPSRRPKVKHGAPPVVYELRGNTLGPAHPLHEPAGAAAAAVALRDIESGTATTDAPETKDMLQDAQRGNRHGMMQRIQLSRLRADAAFWRKVGKKAPRPGPQAAVGTASDL